MKRDHLESIVTVLAMFAVGISKLVNYHAIEMTGDGFHFYRY